MKEALTFIYCLCVLAMTQAQVTLSTDFTDSTKEKAALSNIWTIANRISPKSGAGVRPEIDVNLIRMIGGIKKTVNGVNVPDLDFDPVSYDGATDTYIYNWAPLISRLNKIVNSDTKIHQLVLDQVPWAFQNGFTFIPKGTYDGIHFREDERMTTYGNSLPPYDKVAYFNFIKALMEELIATYGEEEVLSWRFRVGSEIETPDHWKGTEQDFIEHFANTEKAVREVLPNAKIGLHTRHPGFVYRNGTVKNYKGESIQSFASGLIEYSYDNNIQYDFWGVSDYVLINGVTQRNIFGKYDYLFAPLVNHPKWNSNATLDLMEYSVVTSMSPPVPDGYGTLSCATSHTALVNLGLAHMFYKNETSGLEKIYRWGQRLGTSDPISIEVLKTMEGKWRYDTEMLGTPEVSNNQLDAIFSKTDSKDEFDVMLYNFNVNSLAYRNNEPVTVSFKTDLLIGTLVYYRDAVYGKDQNKLQNFLKNEPPSGWVKTGWDRKADPKRIFNEAGATAWATFENPNPYAYNEWKVLTTIARSDGGEGSMVTIDSEMPSFAFRKFEFRRQPDFVEALSPPKIKWTTNQDFQEFSPADLNTSIDNNLLDLSLTGNFPKIIRDQSMEVDVLDKFNIVLNNETTSDIFWFVWYKNGVKNQTRFKPSINETSFNSYTIDLSTKANWTGTIDSFNVEIANRAGSGSVTIESMEFFIKPGVVEHSVLVDVEGMGLVSPSSGTCYTGQTVKLIATPNEGWAFSAWTGSITSSDNPLDITVNSDVNIKATFIRTLSMNDGLFKNGFSIYPNPSDSGIFNLSQNHKWEVYSISGVKMSSGEGKQIDLSPFAQGLYLLKTEIGSFKLVKK